MYDAIVVGARCAGSPTAMLLARKGFKVLLVDRTVFPSDTLSTHILWPHGAETMKQWGLLRRLAETGVPPICRHMRFDVGPFALVGTIPDANDGEGGFCPRRTVLDKLLLDAAAEAGVDVRQDFAVTGEVATLAGFVGEGNHSDVDAGSGLAGGGEDEAGDGKRFWMTRWHGCPGFGFCVGFSGRSLACAAG